MTTGSANSLISSFPSRGIDADTLAVIEIYLKPRADDQHVNMAWRNRKGIIVAHLSGTKAQLTGWITEQREKLSLVTTEPQAAPPTTARNRTRQPALVDG